MLKSMQKGGVKNFEFLTGNLAILFLKGMGFWATIIGGLDPVRRLDLKPKLPR